MHIKKISILSLLCLVSGSIFFLFHKKFIIIHFNTKMPSHEAQIHDYHVHKKEISCYFWHRNGWQEEKKTVYGPIQKNLILSK